MAMKRVTGVSNTVLEDTQQTHRPLEAESLPLPLVKFHLNYQDATLNYRLREERVSVNEMECPRIRDVANFLINHLEITDVCEDGIHLKIGDYYLNPKESMHVIRNGDTVTICIARSESARERRKQKRQRLNGSTPPGPLPRQSPHVSRTPLQQQDPQTSTLQWHLGQA